MSHGVPRFRLQRSVEVSIIAEESVTQNQIQSVDIDEQSLLDQNARGTHCNTMYRQRVSLRQIGSKKFLGCQRLQCHRCSQVRTLGPVFVAQLGSTLSLFQGLYTSRITSCWECFSDMVGLKLEKPLKASWCSV